MPNKLTASQIDGFRLLLNARYAELREEIHQELVQSEDEQYQRIAGEVRDRQDQSLADLLVDINLAVIDRHIEELRDIETALNRIRLGSYGSCTTCHRPVAFSRLEAYPTAKRCLHCQKLQEESRSKSGSRV